jgi:uncharacterized OB-fold protein
MADLVYDQRIELPYVYTAGAAQRAALDGLRDGALMASQGAGFTNAPAVPFGPDGAHLREIVQTSAEGTIEACTTARHRPGEPVLALIRIDGASNVMLHRLAAGAQPPAPGARVRAVWEAQRTGSILDISHFEPVGDEGQQA